jgi:twinkle protein
MFTPGKVKIVHLAGYKDPGEMLVAGKAEHLIRALWDARPYRPDGIRSFSDVAPEAKAAITVGLPWFNKRITALTYGRRLGEMCCLGAGTGVGKTDFIMQQVAYDAMVLEEKVGLFFFEQQNFETAKRLAGKHAGKAFHIPDGMWVQGELDEAVDEIAATDRVFLYNHFGVTDWEIVASRIKFLALSQGVKLFYIDNLTSLADPEKERESLEKLMGQCGGLAQALGIWIFLVSHLSTPQGGTPHEEGGKVLLQHFKGARAIGFWLSFAFGIERNRLSEDPLERRLARFVFIKDRFTGRSDGEFIYFLYNTESCLLEQYDGPLPESMTEAGKKPHWQQDAPPLFAPYAGPPEEAPKEEGSTQDATSTKHDDDATTPF